MEPTIELVLLGLVALAALVAARGAPQPDREPVPVRVDEDERR